MLRSRFVMLCIGMGMHQRVQWLAEHLVPRAVGIVAVEAWPVRPLILVRVVRIMEIPMLVAVEVVVEEEGAAVEGPVEGVVVVVAVVAVVVAAVVVANFCTIA